MEIEAFRTLVAAVRAQKPRLIPTKESIEELGLEVCDIRDPLATDEDIDNAERDLEVRLPDKYVFFLKNYGGGTFGYEEIYSVQLDGGWDIRAYQPDSSRPLSFLAISPNGCGDYYGFRVNNGICEPAVSFMDHEENYTVRSTEYEDILDYIARCALKEDGDDR